MNLTIEQALQILDQVVHNPQLNFLPVKDAVLTEQALQVVIQYINRTEQDKKNQAEEKE